MIFTPESRIDSTGIQSLVEIGNYNGVSAVRKFSGQNLNQTELNQVVWAIPDYRDQLEIHGLKLAESFELNHHGRHLEIIDEYIPGPDVDTMVRKKSAELPFVWRDMVRTICQLNNGGYKSSVAIDAKPANFIRHRETNELFYIDLYPPMLRNTNGLIEPWIERLYKRNRQMMSFNFGDTRGQIVKLLAGSKLAYPQIYPELKLWTLGQLDGNLPTPVMDYVNDQVRNDFPDMTTFYSGQPIDKVLARLSS